jgi:hypothetical protein
MWSSQLSIGTLPDGKSRGTLNAVSEKSCSFFNHVQRLNNVLVDSSPQFMVRMLALHVLFPIDFGISGKVELAKARWTLIIILQCFGGLPF